MTGEKLNYLKVPSCQNCNGLASDEPHTNIIDRKYYVKERIKHKYGKYLDMPDWEDDEIDELDFRLQQSVRAAMEMKYLIAYRLEYGLERNYFKLDQYLNFDPRKIFKYAKAENWDKSLEKMEGELSLGEVQKMFSSKERQKGEYSYSKAQKTVRELGIRNSSDYFSWRKVNKHNKKRDSLPPNPPKEFELFWSGWPDFIGPSYVNSSVACSNKKVSYLNYSEARDLSREMGAKNSSDYASLRRKSPEMVSTLPSQPKSYYGDDWTGWEDFLGDSYVNLNEQSVIDTSSYLSFEYAQKYARNCNIRNASHYGEYRRKNKEFKDNLPSNPHKFYKKNWNGWESFLGDGYHSNVIKNPKFVTYREAQKLVTQYGAISNSATFHAIRKRHEELHVVPSSPSTYYRDEWKGWQEFLGKNYKNKNLQYLSK